MCQGIHSPYKSTIYPISIIPHDHCKLTHASYCKPGPETYHAVHRYPGHFRPHCTRIDYVAIPSCIKRDQAIFVEFVTYCFFLLPPLLLSLRALSLSLNPLLVHGIYCHVYHVVSHESSFWSLCQTASNPCLVFSTIPLEFGTR